MTRYERRDLRVGLCLVGALCLVGHVRLGWWGLSAVATTLFLTAFCLGWAPVEDA